MRKMTNVTGICWHHSATHSGSVADFRAEHMSRKEPFEDIGYHFVIGNGDGMRDGAIAPGRPERFEGAGVYGHNTGLIHVCVVGCFEPGHPEYRGGGPTRGQLIAIGMLANRLRGRYPGARTTCHREEAIRGHGTLCPGKQFPIDALRSWLGIAPVFRDRSFAEWLGKQPSQASAPKPAGGVGQQPTPPAAPPTSATKVWLSNQKGDRVEVPHVLVEHRNYIELNALCHAMAWSIESQDNFKTVVVHILPGG